MLKNKLFKKYKSGFTPLKKAADFNRRSLPLKTNGGLKPPLAQTVRERSSLTGFTLLELMIAIGVLIVALVGLLGVFAHMISLNENSGKLTLSIAACQAKLEEIRNSTFSDIDIYAAYNGTSFNPQGFASGEAKGAISINNSNPNLLQIFVSVSWMTRSNRIIGEDRNLDGVLNAGEDSNANGRLDSPAGIATLMAQR